MGASARIASARRAAFAPRAAALLLLVAFACVAPLAAGAGDAHAEDGGNARRERARRAQHQG